MYKKEQTFFAKKIYNKTEIIKFQKADSWRVYISIKWQQFCANLLYFNAVLPTFMVFMFDLMLKKNVKET